MNAERYTVHAPGKLFIAGEYAVTEAGYDSIVIAVDRYLSVDIQSNQQNRLDLPELKLTNIRWQVKDNKVSFSIEDPRLNFIKSVIETFVAYAGEQKPVHIVVTSELDDQSGKKYGLGSSAALSVAVMTALLKCSNLKEKASDPLIIYKLASIAHFKTQGNGSCADIAASAYGGWLNYCSFISEWLINQLETGQSIEKIVQSDWPSLKITPLQQPENFHLLIGWTQESARTGPMVEKVKELKLNQPTDYETFLTDSQKAVERIVTGFRKENSEDIFAGVRANREALKNLGRLADVLIETDALTQLIDAVSNYGAAKSSGAGGGDCGIALVSNQADRQQIYQLWKESGIEPLDLKVSYQGVNIH